MENDTIHLTLDQAVEAVHSDFRQYPPQLMLFCEVHRIIAVDGAVMKRDSAENAVWVSVPGRDEMRRLTGSSLVAYMCERVNMSALSIDRLAVVCSRVFQARVWPETDAETGLEGLRIETGMEGFECRQCGLCCRSLDYRNELSADDVARWELSGREDILEWVGSQRNRGGSGPYQMWLVPGTRQFADVCPFLKQKPSENRWICQIHDSKPEICRNYPVSRKHAVMTGCPGFNPRGSKK